MRKALTLLAATAALTACETDDDGRDDIGAAVMCEQFITERLVSPSSAEFPGTWDYTITGAGDEYTISGHVDSDNAFGASLRTQWTCTVRDNGDETWTLVDLQGLN